MHYLGRSINGTNAEPSRLNGRTRLRSPDQATAEGLTFDFPASRRNSTFSHHVDTSRSVVVQMPQMSEGVQDADMFKVASLLSVGRVVY